MDEKGIIKFQCFHKLTELITDAELLELIKYRNIAYEKGYIGVYNNGIGYGNISLRVGNGFYVSGSATGHIPVADQKQFSKVTDWDINLNKLWCEGPVKASSESLTHAAIYQTKPETKAILHIHNSFLWKSNDSRFLQIPQNIEYGTTQMANAVAKITKNYDEGILLMLGHQDGLIGYAKSLEEVFSLFTEI